MTDMSFGGRKGFGPAEDPEGSGFGKDSGLLRSPSDLRRELSAIKGFGVGAEIPLALCELAFGEMYNLRFERAKEYLEEAFVYQPRKADPMHQESEALQATRMWNYVLRAHLALLSGDEPHDASPLYREALPGFDLAEWRTIQHPLIIGGPAPAENLGTAFALCRYHTFMCLSMQTEGPSDVMELSRLLRGAVHASSDPLDHGLLSTVLSDIARLSGREDEAIQLAADAEQLIEDSGQKRLLPEAWSRMAMACLRTGNLDWAAEAIEKIDRHTSEVPEQRLYRTEGRLIGAMLSGARGERVKARAELDAIQAICGEHEFRHLLRPGILPKFRDQLTHP